MDDDKLMEYLKEMEARLQMQIEAAKKDIIEELETSLMEIGVYKKEILSKIKGIGQPAKAGIKK